MLGTMRHHSLFPMPLEVTQLILGGGSPIDLDAYGFILMKRPGISH